MARAISSFTILHTERTCVHTGIAHSAVLLNVSWAMDYVGGTCQCNETSISGHREKCSRALYGTWIFAFAYRSTSIRLSTDTKSAFTLTNCAWEIVSDSQSRCDGTPPLNIKIYFRGILTCHLPKYFYWTRLSFVISRLRNNLPITIIICCMRNMILKSLFSSWC